MAVLLRPSKLYDNIFHMMVEYQVIIRFSIDDGSKVKYFLGLKCFQINTLCIKKSKLLRNKKTSSFERIKSPFSFSVNS